MGGEANIDLQLKLEAIKAIKGMPALGQEATEILTSIYENASISPELRPAAGTAEVLPASHLRLGTSALMLEKYDEAKEHFNSALNAGSAESNAVATITLGLDLVFMSHERMALEKPEAFVDSYQISSKLRPLGQRDPDSRTSIEVNLAEASLTVGRYADAERIAGDLLQENNLDRESRINMQLIVFAARLLKGDEPGAEKAKQDLLKFYDSLPKGFKNTWSYDGTRHYVQSKLPQSQQNDLTLLMDKIRAK